MFQGITPSVDPSFNRKLKAIDPGLSCEFDRRYGKFIIYQQGKISGKVPALMVEGNDGGGYCYPHDGHLKILQQSDMHKSGQEVRDRIQKGEEYMAGERVKVKKFTDEEFRARTAEDKIQLANEYCKTFNLGKGNSAHRRITPKPKGFVVRDKRLVKAESTQ